MNPTQGNTLSTAKSPYLRQHADNPVAWQTWSKEPFEQAVRENKLVLVSIGYSACHWCHVMEKESFSIPEVAQVMNENFICIKVDREEHPDVDHLYMEAVQLMTGQGGWPLNCFVLPDKRPVYGGTYFRKEDWLRILDQLAKLYKEAPDKVNSYAEKLTAGLIPTELEEVNSGNDEIKESLKNSSEELKSKLDKTWGGTVNVPKFPVPVGIQFQLKLGMILNDQELTAHVFLTLERLARGGIFDHLKGGFARYSTDQYWKVPHFEKMLYDNGQLLSIFSNGYKLTKSKEYKSTIEKTVEFLRSDLLSPEGCFYSALDADTEGEEGKYYVWSKSELESITGDDFPLMEKTFYLDEKDVWEHGNFVLMKRGTVESGEEKITQLEKRLLSEREKRVKPALDNKVIVSWNALAISGLSDAAMALGNWDYLELAVTAAEFFIRNKKEGQIFHCYSNGEGYINGYLEDYAFMCEAFLNLNKATGDSVWLEKAMELAEIIIQNYYDSETKSFYLSSGTGLPVPVTDLYDSVMPSAVSTACYVLYKLGLIFGKEDWVSLSRNFAGKMIPMVEKHPTGFGNWGILLAEMGFDSIEIVVTGEDLTDFIREINFRYYPLGMMVVSSTPREDIEILQNRFESQNRVFVCKNQTCSAPVSTVTELLSQL